MLLRSTINFYSVLPVYDWIILNCINSFMTQESKELILHTEIQDVSKSNWFSSFFLFSWSTGKPAQPDIMANNFKLLLLKLLMGIQQVFKLNLQLIPICWIGTTKAFFFSFDTRNVYCLMSESGWKINTVVLCVCVWHPCVHIHLDERIQYVKTHLWRRSTVISARFAQVLEPCNALLFDP